MSEQPINQPTAPGDPASGVQRCGEALSSEQPATKPTAEERVRRAAVHHGYPLWQAYPITSLEATGDVVVRLMEEHAAAAVKELEARIAQLERERDQLREDIERCAEVGWYGLVEHARRAADSARFSAHRLAVRETKRLDAINARLRASLGEEADRE